MAQANGSNPFTNAVKQIIDHKISTAVILVLVIALIVVSTARFSEPSGASASQKTGAAPSATEQYFKGQTDFDASLIWESLSDELIQRAELTGATQDDLQQQLDEARDLGREVENIVYIGGYNLDDGGSMQFYVVTVRGSESAMSSDQMFYVFTLDDTGKILSIE
ncbi:MAG: hypothetical protein HYY30_13415 [Chloroflexi bacterium]|nr:hypothetical protein [Chloroflexota bacterium]